MRRRPGLLAWMACAWAIAMAACSGGGSEQLECTDISQCKVGSTCLRGYCMETDEAVVSASARSAGADVPVLVIDAAGSTCEASVCADLPYGSQVTFRAGEAPGFRFTGWSGSPECSATGLELVVAQLTRDTNCVANYVRRLKVAGITAGIEGGVSASSGSGYAECNGGVCIVDVGATVKLTASDRLGERFTGWTGAGCGDSKALELLVTALEGDLLCTANFTPRITVSGRAMNAEVAIEVSSPGAVCEPGSCILDKNGSVTLSAPPVKGFRFAGWSGTSGCTGTNATLALEQVAEAQLCLATYMPRVTVSGSSAGATPAPPITALSSDLYASCSGSACETDKMGSVTLLASSANGYRLSGWSGPQCEAQTGAAVELAEVASDLACVANYVQGIAVIGAVVGAPGEVVASSTTPLAQCAAGSCIFDVGGQATLTAPSIPGYRFLGWDGDEGCTSAAQTIEFSTVAQSRTCYARFATRFLVRGSAAPPEGGSVRASSSSAGASCSNESCTLDGGGEVLLEAVPASGARFSGWSGGGACSGSEPMVRVTSVAGNVTCQANFVSRINVGALAAPAGGGMVTARSDSAASSCMGASCQIDQGSRVVFTAMPSEGFRFTSWSQCSDSPELTLTLEGVRRDTMCQANFTPLRYTVSSSVAPPDTGSVVASASTGQPECGGGRCTVDYGSSVTLTAMPATGWRFSAWAGCVSSNDATINVNNVRSDVGCQATFERIFLRVDASAGSGGSVAATSTTQAATCNGAGCTVPYGGEVVLSAAAQTGFRFTAWSGCSTSGDATLRLGNITAGASCVANFERLRFRVTGTPAPGDGGSVVASSSAAAAACGGASCTVDFGSAVSLAATPARGFRFTGWTGCQTSNAASINVANVRDNVTCQANFERLRFVVTGSANSEPQGSVMATSASPGASCASNRCEVSFGSSVTLTPAPAPGSRFVGWSNCPVTGGGPITLPSVEGNLGCQANFERLSFRVNGVAGPGGAIAATAGGAMCPDAACSVGYGASVTFTAVPATGFAIAGFMGCAVSANPAVATIGNVMAPATCTVAFERIAYRVNGTTTGGGSISGSSNGAPCADAVCSVPFGGSATFTAGADTPALRFVGFSGGCTATEPGARSAVVTNVSMPVTCNANFRTASYTVRGTSEGGGSISATLNGATCANASCDVPFNGTVVFTAGPDTGAVRFSAFEGACTATGPRTAEVKNVAANASCTARFVPANFTVVGRATGGGTISATRAGVACPAAMCSVPFNDGVVFTAGPDTPAATFTRFSGACAAIGARTAQITNVSADAACIAEFSPRSYTITGRASNGGGISGTVGGQPCGGGGSVCSVPFGDGAVFTATAPANYAISTWTGCTQDPANPLRATVSSVAADGACVANFAPSTVTITTAVVGSGKAYVLRNNTECASTSGCVVPVGTVVTLTQQPGSSSSVFTGWTGCVTSTQASVQLTATVSATCTANFGPAPRITVATVARGRGTVAASSNSPNADCTSGTSCTVPPGESVSISAYPSTGFEFAGWSGCPSDQEAQSSVTSNVSVTCTAQFNATPVSPPPPPPPPPVDAGSVTIPPVRDAGVMTGSDAGLPPSPPPLL
jgi:hypothetical protein